MVRVQPHPRIAHGLGVALSCALERHACEVARLARLTSLALGVQPAEAGRIELAALLHDVGKTRIPEAILSKEGPLDIAEWAVMRTHTLVGEQIVRGSQEHAHAADLVRSSHERVDGGGYPDGLSGAEIPLGARIIAVCDSFHAMTSDRSYRRAVSRAPAIAELRRSAGSQFDPVVVEAFIRASDGRRQLSHALRANVTSPVRI